MKRALPRTRPLSAEWDGDDVLRLIVRHELDRKSWSRKFRMALAVAIIEAILLAIYVVLPAFWRQL